jgi:hypothetical protein
VGDSPAPAPENDGGRTAAAAQPGDRVAVVIGSTRPTRICPGIAAWVRDAAQEGSPLRYDLLDLAEINLPLLDEPLRAARGRELAAQGHRSHPAALPGTGQGHRHSDARSAEQRNPPRVIPQFMTQQSRSSRVIS